MFKITDCEARGREAETTLNDVLAKLRWSSVRQVFGLWRKRITRDWESGEQKKTRGVVYGITDLTREQTDANRLLGYNRSHWGIENNSHHTRDVTFCEDNQRARTGFGPIMMSSVRYEKTRSNRSQTGSVSAVPSTPVWTHPVLRLDLRHIILQ